MTLTSQQTKVVYRPDGITTEFTVPFPVFDAADIECIAVAVRRGTSLTDSDSDDSVTDSGETIYTSGFTVNGIERGIVSIRFARPPSPESRLVIRRATRRVQESDYPVAGRFPAKTVEHDLDRIVGMVQELNEEMDRAVLAPVDDSVTPEELLQRIFGADDSANAAAARAESSADAVLSSETNAATSASDAAASAAQASSSAGLARKWAENPEDDPVIPDHYSAYHWAKKALENAGGGGLVDTVNGIEPDADKNVRLVHEVTQAQYDALKETGTLAHGAEYVITDGAGAPSLIVIGATGREYAVSRTIRERATGDTTLYVRKTGSDESDGRTEETAVLTIGRALALATGIDFSGFRATLDIGPGTWSPENNASSVLSLSKNTFFGAGAVFVYGVGENTIFDGLPQNNKNSYGVYLTQTTATIENISFQNLFYAVYATMFSTVVLNYVYFGACTEAHIGATLYSKVGTSTGYSIRGGAMYHITATYFSIIKYNGWSRDTGLAKTIALTGTPNFSVSFFELRYMSYSYWNSSILFSGAATGQRYDCQFLSFLRTGMGANYFPGNVAGKVAHGGIYI